MASLLSSAVNSQVVELIIYPQIVFFLQILFLDEQSDSESGSSGKVEASVRVFGLSGVSFSYCRCALELLDRHISDGTII